MYLLEVLQMIDVEAVNATLNLDWVIAETDNFYNIIKTYYKLKRISKAINMIKVSLEVKLEQNRKDK